jgi:uncharacterized protein
MRITEQQKNAIIDAVISADQNAKVWLFGSRVDDGKKGGDIDIGVLSSIAEADVMQEIEIRQKIFDTFGGRKIDLVVSKDGQEAFFKYAVQKGILLNG